jgi:hypothetical protein
MQIIAIESCDERRRKKKSIIKNGGLTKSGEYFSDDEGRGYIGPAPSEDHSTIFFFISSCLMT